jgi:hypothetical protein
MAFAVNQAHCWGIVSRKILRWPFEILELSAK